MVGQEQEVEELREFLVSLQRLNPDYPLAAIDRAETLASSIGGQMFDEASSLVEAAVKAYLASPQKVQGGAILAEYFGLLESEERRLLAAGLDDGGLSSDEAADLREAAALGDLQSASVMALVPVRDVPPLTRCIVLNKSRIPDMLSKAADAYRRRNVVVDTVVEIGFRLLWRMDAARAEQWCLHYLEREKGALDPDVVRDLLRTAVLQPVLSRRFLQWVLEWCGDMRLLENWPYVVFTGDRVLCNHAVRAWLQTHQPRNPSTARLKLLYAQNSLDDETLLHWLESALAMVANCVMRIMALGELNGNAADDGYGNALFTELRRLSGIYAPVMMVGNQLLCLPDGAQQFAMAVFGLAGDELARWDEQLDAFCAKVIRRTFILDMRASRSPVDTIRRLTFGDDDAFRLAYSQLDLVTETFDSPRQREKVIDILVPFYSSFRRDKFLSSEITRRYRKIMRMLHDDYLEEVLDKEQLEALHGEGTVYEMSALIGEARKYLNRQRDQISSLERILASRIGFEEDTRRRRLNIIRKQLAL